MAFVIMPFDSQYTINYKSVFVPALEKAGYKVVRGDDYHTTNPITHDIEKAIVESELILCEISSKNPNVFYELALAHAMAKHVIIVANRNEPLPFDVSHIRVIQYDVTEKLWHNKLLEAITTTANAIRDEEPMSPLVFIGKSFRQDVRPHIKYIFHFFRETISVFSRESSKFRLHLLRYFEKDNMVKMYVQDETYPDKNFEIHMDDGIKKGVAVCQAIQNEKLVYIDLPKEHYTFYSDSSIPERLCSVMAYPIFWKKRKIFGAISLDSMRKFSDLGIDIEDLESLFVKLCNIVEGIIQMREYDYDA